MQTLPGHFRLAPKAKVDLRQTVTLLFLNEELDTTWLIPVNLLASSYQVTKLEIVERSRVQFAFKHFRTGVPPSRQRLVIARYELLP